MQKVNCDRLAKLLGLDFWIKTVGIFIPVSIFVGYILLNCYYAFWWGFVDDGVSKAACTAVMIWFVITLIQAGILGVILDFLTTKIEESRHRTLIIASIVVLAAVLTTVSFAPPARAFANSHQIHLPPRCFLLILVGIFHCCLLLGLTAPVAWLRGIIKQRPLLDGIFLTPRATKKELFEYFCGLLTLAPVLAFLFWVFSGTYLLIPARYGGGGPDPIDLWISRDAQSIFSGMNCKIISANQEGGENCVMTIGAEYLHYSGLYLIHEGSDNMVLTADHCDQILRIPKELVKGLQWRNQRFTEPNQAQKKSSVSQNPAVSNPH